MTETVVHVTTLEQWKSVLDVWFKQGYSWYETGTEYNELYFRDGKRFLLLDNDNDIITPSHLNRKIIDYSEFMAQQKEDKEVKTYYVTKERLNTIEVLKNKDFPLNGLLNKPGVPLSYGLNGDEEKALLRYLGGDETIEFKAKEKLYRLWRIDEEEGKVYMMFHFSTPTWTSDLSNAFTASLEEITKWKTPAWEIEKAD